MRDKIARYNTESSENLPESQCDRSQPGSLSEQVVLRPWQEILGTCAGTTRIQGNVTITISVRRLHTVTVPEGSLDGRLPQTGKPIALLRTDEGYVVRNQARTARRTAKPNAERMAVKGEAQRSGADQHAS
jgi:hypothetical protein